MSTVIWPIAACGAAAGVNIGYCTDLCWSPKRYQGDGLMIHQEVCGPAEALRHVTIKKNAKVVRMKGQIGDISEGACADLLVVEANPLDDLACFGQHDNKVVSVLQDGRAVRDGAAAVV